MEPILPKLPLVKLVAPEIATTPLPPNPGALKFGWLRMLKNSVRNCAENRSLIAMALNSERSRRWNPGPFVVGPAKPRAPLPDKGMQPAGEPGIGPLLPNLQGCWKAFALPNQYNP